MEYYNCPVAEQTLENIFFSECHSFLDFHSLRMKIHTAGHLGVKEMHYCSQTLTGQNAREMEWFVNFSSLPGGKVFFVFLDK